MIDEIKSLYKSLKKDKTAFIEKVADALGLAPQYVRVHYFGNFWSIPKDNQPIILEMLKEEHELQKATA